MKDKIIFLVGPTAVGKTEIAVHLARKINAEIISCDSMQVYKKMDIITSKPSRALRKLIPHYLIDVLSPIREYNVSRYRKDALKKIKAVLKKGKVPLFVGGTGLYMSILVDGIFEAKSENETVRKKLYKEAEDNGSAYLYNRLVKLDSEAAFKIHPNDTKRIVRALEVYETTGKPISQLQKQRKGLIDKYEVSIFCLHIERDKLNQRIHRRLEQMFRQGLIEEVRSLLKLELSKTAHCAIGIKELKGFFCGAYDLEDAKKLMRRNTRLYAKRQLTWFRKDKRIEWINIADGEKPRETANRILNKF